MPKVKLSLIFSALLWLSSAHALTVISDIDDTIKISHVNDTPGAIGHAALTEAFSGMSAVYQDLVTSGTASQFFYVSGSPFILNQHLHTFLEVNHFPIGPIELKHFGDPSNIEAYKLSKIRAILNQMTDSVILIGDDTQKDAATYVELSQEFPGRVDSIYIHRVTGNALPPEVMAHGVKLFTSSADLAVVLYQNHKLPAQSVSDTAQLLLNDPRDHVVSDYQSCPTDLLTTSIPSIDHLLSQVQTKVLTWCNTDGL